MFKHRSAQSDQACAVANATDEPLTRRSAG